MYLGSSGDGEAAAQRVQVRSGQVVEGEGRVWLSRRSVITTPRHLQHYDGSGGGVSPAGTGRHLKQQENEAAASTCLRLRLRLCTDVAATKCLASRRFPCLPSAVMPGTTPKLRPRDRRVRVSIMPPYHSPTLHYCLKQSAGLVISPQFAVSITVHCSLDLC